MARRRPAIKADLLAEIEKQEGDSVTVHLTERLG
jgi:hypothetical protein